LGDGISDCLLFGDGFCLSLPMMAAEPTFRSVVAPNNSTCKTGFGGGILVGADAGAGLGVVGAGGNVGAG